MKKIIWGTVAGGIFSFFFGWLMYGIVLSGMMQSCQSESMAAISLPEDQMNWLFLILSNFLWALLLAFVFVKWAGVNSWLGGLKVGAILSILIALAYDTSFYSMTTLFTFSGMIFDIVFSVIYSSIIGAFIGFVISKIK